MEPGVDRFHYYKEGVYQPPSVPINAPGTNEPGTSTTGTESAPGTAKPPESIILENTTGTTYMKEHNIAKINDVIRANDERPLKKKEIYKVFKGCLRKRFRFWVSHGKSFKEAMRLAPKKLWTVPDYKLIKEQQKRLKLQRMKERKKLAKSLGISVAEVAASEGKIKVQLKDTPLVTIASSAGPMTEKEMEKVRDEIIRVVECSTIGYGPDFLGCTVIEGKLVLTCSSELNRDWLVEHISEIKPLEGVTLQIVENPKYKIGDMWVLDRELTEDALLRRLDAQNLGLNFLNWRILERKIYEQGQHVKFFIDDATYNILAKRQFHLKFNNGHVTIKVLPPDYLKVLDSAKEALTGSLENPNIVVHVIKPKKRNRYQQDSDDDSDDGDNDPDSTEEGHQPYLDENNRQQPARNAGGNRGGRGANKNVGRGTNRGVGRGTNRGAAWRGNSGAGRGGYWGGGNRGFRGGGNGYRGGGNGPRGGGNGPRGGGNGPRGGGIGHRGVGAGGFRGGGHGERGGGHGERGGGHGERGGGHGGRGGGHGERSGGHGEWGGGNGERGGGNGGRSGRRRRRKGGNKGEGSGEDSGGRIEDWL